MIKVLRQAEKYKYEQRGRNEAIGGWNSISIERLPHGKPLSRNCYKARKPE